MKYFIDRYNEVREPDAELIFYGKIRYSMHYYFGKANFEHFELGQLDELTEFVEDKPHVYVISESRSSRFNPMLQRLRRAVSRDWYPLGGGHPRYVFISNVRHE